MVALRLRKHKEREALFKSGGGNLALEDLVLNKILKGQNSPPPEFEKYFALFVLTQSESHDDFRNKSQELYLHRNEGSDEDRALYAIALHQQNIMARERARLLRLN